MTIVFRNFDVFQRKLGAFSRRTLPRTYERRMKALALDGLSRVMDKMPVDTGLARGGWRLTIGQPNRTPTITKSPSGQPENTEAYRISRATIQGFKAGQKIVLSNAIPYVIYLEEGTDTQPPMAMLRSTMAELREVYG